MRHERGEGGQAAPALSSCLAAAPFCFRRILEAPSGACRFREVPPRQPVQVREGFAFSLAIRVSGFREVGCTEQAPDPPDSISGTPQRRLHFSSAHGTGQPPGPYRRRPGGRGEAERQRSHAVARLFLPALLALLFLRPSRARTGLAGAPSASSPRGSKVEGGARPRPHHPAS